MLGDSEEEYVLDAFADGSKDQAQAELTQGEAVFFHRRLLPFSSLLGRADYGAFETQYQGELDKIEDALDEVSGGSRPTRKCLTPIPSLFQNRASTSDGML